MPEQQSRAALHRQKWQSTLMELLRLTLNRTFQFVLLVFLVASATFLLSTLIPGDFFTSRELDPTVSRETIEGLRSNYGLDQPPLKQYAQWLRNAAALDLGFSLYYQLPVSAIVRRGLSHTLWIGLPALFLGLSAGIVFGSLHAWHVRRPLGTVLDFLAVIALSLPSLVLGLGALILAARSQWFPLGSMNSPSLPDPGLVAWLWDRLHHLILPVFCLGLPIAAYVERIQFSAASAEAESFFIRAARARGLHPARLFFQYWVRPALNPVLSVAGPLFAAALSGSLVIEILFAWPGLGQITYDALFSRDLFLLVGCVTAGGVLLIIGNIAADVLLHVIDPRTRTSEEAES